MLGSLSSACSLLRWSVISVCLVCFGKTCLGLNIPPTETEYGLVDSDGGPPQGGGITFNDRVPEYRWIDITGNGSVVVSNGDDSSSVSPKPNGIARPVELGHPFPFFGVYYSELVPTSNGYIGSLPGETGADATPDCPFQPNPKTWTGGARIAAFHADLDVTGGQVLYRYFEVSPHPHRDCGVSVFTWDNVLLKANGQRTRFQVLLFDNGDILCQYEDSDLAKESGAAWSIGIHNAAASESLAYKCESSAVDGVGTSLVLFEPYEIIVETASELEQALVDSRPGGKIRFLATNEPLDLSTLTTPLTVAQSLTIDGTTGVTSTRTFRPVLTGNNAARLFQVNPGIHFLIHDCDLIEGSATAGGAIWNNGGFLKASQINFRHNQATTGGAIASTGGVLKITNSNLIANEAAQGAAVQAAQAEVVLHSATFYLNRTATPDGTGTGGGIHLLDCSSSLTNTTFSDNQCGGTGGAIYTENGTLSLHYCTIMGNGSASAYAVYADGTSVETGHSIFAENTENYKGLNGATLTSNGYNLEDGSAMGLSTLGDLSNTGADLSPIGLHGGFVLTRHPRAGSPAIEGGVTASLVTLHSDARGLARATDWDENSSIKSDIGAVEAGVRYLINRPEGTFVVLAPGEMALYNAIDEAPDGAHLVFDAALSGNIISVIVIEEITQDGLFIDGSLTSPRIVIDGTPPSLIYNQLSTSSLPLSIDSVILRGSIKCPVLNLHGSQSPDLEIECELLFSCDSTVAGVNAKWSSLKAFAAVGAASGSITLGNQTAFSNGPNRRLPEMAELRQVSAKRVVADEVNAFSSNRRIRFEECNVSGSSLRGIELTSWGDVTILDTVVSDNAKRGVAVSANRFTMERCSILNNGGGGLLIAADSGTLRNSTISGNQLTQLEGEDSKPQGGTHLDYISGGAGVDVVSTEPFLIEYCTIYNNSYNSLRVGEPCVGHDDLDNNQICDNTPSPERQTGGLLFRSGSSIEVRNSIIARNRITLPFSVTPSYSEEPARLDNLGFEHPLIQQPNDFTYDFNEAQWIDSLGGNLLDTEEFTAYGIAMASDIESTDPQLSPLFNHGGRAPSHLPLAASPAIDAALGTPAVWERDVRGQSRRVQGRIVGTAAPDIGALEAAQPLVVTSLDDGPSGSLRDILSSVQEHGRVLIHPSLKGGSILLSGSSLQVNRSMVVDATEVAGGMVVDAKGGSRVLEISSGSSVAIHGLSLQGGSTSASGGGVANEGDLLITRSLISENTSNQGLGGGIWNDGGALQLHNVTLTDNSAIVGGAVASSNSSRPIEIYHCTIAGNDAIVTGGCHLNAIPGNPPTSPPIRFAATIFADNQDDVGLSNFGGTATDYRSLGFNLTDGAGFGPALLHSEDLTLSNPMLASAPEDRGGFARVLPPMAGSPAIDAGQYIFSLPNLPSLQDARGYFRQLGSMSKRQDIGAYEAYSVDIDGDRMPDRWEDEQALNPTNPGDALVDGDGDGSTHLEEWENGTDPWDAYTTNIDLRPEPSFVYGPSGGKINFDLPSLLPPTRDPIVLGVQVEFSYDLEEWFPLGSPSTGGPGILPGVRTFPLPAIGAKHDRIFYRGSYILDLAGVDLSGENFSGVDFSGLDLSGADFNGADLTDADFSGATLNGVEFGGAILTGVQLWNARPSTFSFESFPGGPSDDVNESLPEFYAAVLETDFSTGHPISPQSPLSHNQFVLAFSPGTTATQATALLTSVGAEVVASLPSLKTGGATLFRIKTEDTDHVGGLQSLQTLESSSVVRLVSPEMQVRTLHAPSTQTTRPPEYGAWNPGDFSTGNWGHKYVRAPQLWNFNEAIEKRIQLGANERNTAIGIVDDPIFRVHDDLQELQIVESGGFTPFLNERHGTKVAGIIGATHGNEGVEGMTPFANLYSRSFAAGFTWAPSLTFYGFTGAHVRHLVDEADVRVINLSIGDIIDEQAVADAGGPSIELLDSIEQQALMFMEFWDDQNGPLLVNAGGNAGLDASVSNAVAYAALELGMDSVLVTEALGPSLQLVSNDNWASAFGGHLSAPGQDIITTTIGGYTLFDGTSAATPLITGTVAYLLSLQPNLTNAHIEELIFQNRNALGTGNGLDAWAAAMDIDRVYGGNATLRMLVDIDDGSLDGNLRVNYSVDTNADQPEEDPTVPLTSENTMEDLDEDGGIGDGSVDMSDYRRARDWALVATFGGPPAILDGAPDNPKHDANRNGVVEGIEESYYPRSDFNGDGDGSGSDDLAPVPGVIGGAMVSDLDVLKQLFNDPDYTKLELDGFEWNTVDLHISLYWFAHYNATNGGDADIFSVDVRVTGTAPGASFDKLVSLAVPSQLLATGADLVFSVPAGQTYEIEVCANTVEDFIYGETIQMTAGQAGTDHWFSPRAFVKLDPGI